MKKLALAEERTATKKNKLLNINTYNSKQLETDSRCCMTSMNYKTNHSTFRDLSTTFHDFRDFLENCRPGKCSYKFQGLTRTNHDPVKTIICKFFTETPPEI